MRASSDSRIVILVGSELVLLIVFSFRVAVFLVFIVSSWALTIAAAVPGRISAESLDGQDDRHAGQADTALRTCQFRIRPFTMRMPHQKCGIRTRPGRPRHLTHAPLPALPGFL